MIISNIKDVERGRENAKTLKRQKVPTLGGIGYFAIELYKEHSWFYL
jgi:hypothetical protein